MQAALFGRELAAREVRRQRDLGGDGEAFGHRTGETDRGAALAAGDGDAEVEVADDAIAEAQLLGAELEADLRGLRGPLQRRAGGDGASDLPAQPGYEGD